MKILHIADVHWRGLSRHQEYVLAFKDLFKQAEELNPDIIYVGGDIVHSKTQGISPELIENLCWWFNGLAKIAPTHVILGNHDGLILNKDRQDAITPIVEALDNPNIFLYKNSGTYEFAPGFEWCVLSCFDEENFHRAKPSKDNVSIALYHGAVRGSLTDVDWQLEGESTLDLFKSYDFALLGDIHKRQFLNKKGTIAYCGSTIQQNFGEDSEKGFLLWDIQDSDNFTCNFYPVENQYHFVTVDWQGDVQKTVNKCREYPNLSRFRIRADNYISQADARRLQKILTKQKAASEVVFKVDSKFDSGKIETNTSGGLSIDLRSPEKHKELIREYYNGNNLLKDDLDKLDDLVDRSLSEISHSDTDLRNVRWSINSLKFDNCFSYTDNNYINFENLPGITGIFGRNARGKSSIIGTIAYALFNTSDRGAIKNIHLINTRKNSCKAELDISVNNVPYRIVRQTIKKQTKKNIWAPTTLKFYRLDKSGEVIEDLTEEQRRETEKIIRGMLGTSEEFSMTSLASQGDMNNFIKEKATARKAILTNFLDLTVFDAMNEFAKKESASLKQQAASINKGDWVKQISIKENSITSVKALIRLEEKSITKLKKDYETYVKELHSNTDNSYITLREVEIAKSKWEKSLKYVQESEVLRDNLKDEIFEVEQKIEKVDLFLSNFDVDDIKQKRDAQKEINRLLSEMQSDLKYERKELLTIEKSVEKLSEVPCGDSFPTCKFIKESHSNKKKLDKQRDKVTALKVKVDDLKAAFKKLGKEDYDAQLDKYNAIVQRKSQLVSSISNILIKINSHEKDIENTRPLIPELETTYKDLKEMFDNQDSNDGQLLLEKKIKSTNNDIKSLDKNRTSLITKLAKEKAERDMLVKQKEEFEKISKSLRAYDLFLQATSNKGIPVQIIHSMLPQINAEISKILKGVVGFTVELEADLDSNSMDIYINYGDSRRIIELGSGMEKMMASLAIRVALINVSSLPKTSMLMIDEGFGALDETNLEACGKLLQSLKKWFKNIVIISHIDEIKDIVDNNIDIIKKGVDSYVYQP
jgi:DNA repair exonuclease SbcCD ATPase subunit